MNFSLFLPQGEGEARVGEEGQRGKPRLSQFCGGREAQGGKMGEGTGYFGRGEGFACPQRKGKHCLTFAQLGGTGNPEVTHFKWPLYASLGGWGS